jgi:hypothetical protein
MAAAGLLLACGAGDSMSDRQTTPLMPGQIVATQATVRFIDLEGGCWVIETGSGRRYQPVNLASGLRTDGLEVNVVMRDAPGVASLCQVGPLVTLDSISPR